MDIFLGSNTNPKTPEDIDLFPNNSDTSDFSGDESEYFPSNGSDSDTSSVNVKLGWKNDQQKPINHDEKKGNQPVGQEISGNKEDLKVRNMFQLKE